MLISMGGYVILSKGGWTDLDLAHRSNGEGEDAADGGNGEVLREREERENHSCTKRDSDARHSPRM